MMPEYQRAYSKGAVVSLTEIMAPKGTYSIKLYQYKKDLYFFKFLRPYIKCPIDRILEVRKLTGGDYDPAHPKEIIQVFDGRTYRTKRRFMFTMVGPRTVHITHDIASGHDEVWKRVNERYYTAEKNMKRGDGLERNQLEDAPSERKV